MHTGNTDFACGHASAPHNVGLGALCCTRFNRHRHRGVDILPCQRTRSAGQQMSGEVLLSHQAGALYIRLDDVEFEFLPHRKCSEHTLSGYCSTCAECRRFPGVMLLTLHTVKWRFSSRARTAHRLPHHQRKNVQPLCPTKNPRIPV